MNININIFGDGSISFISSSNGGKQLHSTNNNGSGIYEDAYDYKFFLNKKYLYVITNLGNVNSSSIDKSFTVLSSTATASIDLIFYPIKQNTDILSKKMINKESDFPKKKYVSTKSNFSDVSGIAQSGKELLTALDYNMGYMNRYFYRRLTIANSAYEINKNQYSALSKNASYSVLKIKWVISGNADEISKQNKNISDKSEVQLPGIKYLLEHDLLKYSGYSLIPEYNIRFDESMGPDIIPIVIGQKI